MLKYVDFTWVGWYNRQEMKLCKIEANGMKSVDFHKAGRYLWAFVRWVLTGVVIGCVWWQQGLWRCCRFCTCK